MRKLSVSSGIWVAMFLNNDKKQNDKKNIHSGANFVP
jgi:hypothetical protein